MLDNNGTNLSDVLYRPNPEIPSEKNRSNLWIVLLVLGLVVIGMGLRFFDLTDQPIDFHPTRQLRSAIIARGFYYRMLPDADPETRERAITYGNTTGQYEPSILEYIVARIYLILGEEALWVARVINSFLWLIGGLALFDMARRGSSTAGGVAALAYYLILPFAVQASRSFQPDPGMVMWLVLSTYCYYRWSEKQEWKWAILAGVLGGIAVLTKIVAAYILAGVAVSIVLFTSGFKNALRKPQVWVMAILMISPTLLFYIGRQGRASDYFADWTLALSHLLLDPALYVRWLNMTQDLMGLAAMLLSIVGLVIARPRYRALLIGLWIGYGLYGLFLPYQMYTHSYYHLQLVPIIALSLAPVAELIVDRVRQEKRIWQALLAGALLIILVFNSWLSILEFHQKDYRIEPAHWQEIATYLPDDGKIIALTQEYGFPLLYYGWRRVTLWPNRGERALAEMRGREKEFQDYFTKRTEGKSYFLITAFSQFNDQEDLKQHLAQNYPVLAEGDGYLIYDLEKSLPPAP